MTYEAVIRFAPQTSVARINDPSRNGRALYDSGALRWLPSETSIPLVVNHDYDREIGRVNKLMRLEDVDGYWTCAVATLNERPSWLRRGTKASFEMRVLQQNSFAEDIIRSALVREVSVLTDDVKPYEPLAQVLYVKPTEEPKPIAIRRSASVARRGITPYDETEELRRRMEFWGPAVPVETILENMQCELQAIRGH